VALNIRTRQPADVIAKGLAPEVCALDPELAPYEVITLSEQVERATSSQRVAVTLLGVLGTLAVRLAAIGLYGVMSYAVSQSTRELGLRMALGARRSALLGVVMSPGLWLTASGVIAGTGIALGGTRLLGYLLYKVSPRDPLAFGSAFLVMMYVRSPGGEFSPRLAGNAHRPGARTTGVRRWRGRILAKTSLARAETSQPGLSLPASHENQSPLLGSGRVAFYIRAQG